MVPVLGDLALAPVVPELGQSPQVPACVTLVTTCGPLEFFLVPLD
jgi:hypothetical protein